MIGNIIKVIIALGSLGLAVYHFAEVNIGYGLMLLFLALIATLFLFRNENILMTLYHLRKQNFAKASASLDRIKNPDHLLIKTQRAYYFYLKGLIEVHSSGLGKSETYFKKAMNIGLKNNTDKAIVKLNLAGIAASRRQISLANNLIAEAKKLDTKGLLSDQIKQFKQQLKSPQRVVQRGGGKRMR